MHNAEGEDEDENDDEKDLAACQRRCSGIPRLQTIDSVSVGAIDAAGRPGV